MKTFQITPVVAVQGNQGASVRTLSWNRTADNAPRHLLVSHSRQDEACRATEARSPRRFTAWQADASARPDLRNTVSLAGQTLLRDSSDSGRRHTLFDAAGRAVWSRDARGTVICQAFDTAGRPASVTEHPAGGTPRQATRYEYDDSTSARQFNLRGATVRGYDDGGLHTLGSVSLSGAPLTQSQRFLADPEARPDWADWQTTLEDEVFVTSTTAGASGAVLTFTDADGSVRHTRYDVSGVPCRQTLTPVGGATQTLLAQVTYSAAGQVTLQRAGNGVTTTCTFEPQTQRLLTLRAVRDNDTTVLQDLSWSYDPVGNILSVTDATVATGHYQNQTTGGTRTFTYDALYQLHTATGRESAASTTAPYAELPALLPADSSQFVPYSRTYAWDDSGNLQHFSHLGAASFTRTMVTATDSDRSLLQNSDSTLTPADVAGAFDPCGNLLRLQVSASASNNMVWDAGNSLECVITLNRSDDLARSDREIYQYSAGLRVRKQTRTLTNSATNLWTVDEVRYLPGLEIRRSWQESGTTRTLNEERHDITTRAGRANIRLLRWLTGKPAGMPDSQLRYSLSDIIGSLSLELDVDGLIISREEYYPFGGTAVWSARSETEADYKVARYAGKERDSTGLYDYGYRYYAPWLCRWTAADPAGEVDGLNLYCMVGNNPVTFTDSMGLTIEKMTAEEIKEFEKLYDQWFQHFLGQKNNELLVCINVVSYHSLTKRDKFESEEEVNSLFKQMATQTRYKYKYPEELKKKQEQKRAKQQRVLESQAAAEKETGEITDQMASTSLSEGATGGVETRVYPYRKPARVKTTAQAILYIWAVDSTIFHQGHRKLDSSKITKKIRKLHQDANYNDKKHDFFASSLNKGLADAIHEFDNWSGDQLAAYLDDYIRKYGGTPPQTLYHGTNMDLRDYSHGHFIATSTSSSAASAFGRVATVTGQRAVSIPNVYPNRNENEYLFSRNARFEISKSGGRYHMAQQ